MARLQVSLTEEQERQLDALARERKLTKSALVREGIEWVLQQKRAATDDPLLDLIGQAGRIGDTDVSTHHDAYLVAAERKQNR